jgi:hypothetical protein
MNHNLVNKFSLPPPSSIQQKNQNLAAHPPIWAAIPSNTSSLAKHTLKQGMESRHARRPTTAGGGGAKKQLVLMNVLIHFMIKLRGCVLLTRKIRLRFQ